MIILAQMWLCPVCITSAGLALWHWMGAWEDEWSRVSLQFVHILCVYCVNNVGLLKTKLFVWVSGNSGSIASVALKEKDQRGFQLRISEGMQSSFIQSHHKETLKHLWVFRRTQPGTTGLGRVYVTFGVKYFRLQVLLEMMNGLKITTGVFTLFCSFSPEVEYLREQF